MYRVIKDFADAQDRGYIYHAGDAFPRDGVEVSAERIAELSSYKNRLKTPLIEKVRRSRSKAIAESEPENE